MVAGSLTVPAKRSAPPARCWTSRFKMSCTDSTMLSSICSRGQADDGAAGNAVTLSSDHAGRAVGARLDHTWNLAASLGAEWAEELGKRDVQGGG